MPAVVVVVPEPDVSDDALPLLDVEAAALVPSRTGARVVVGDHDADGHRGPGRSDDRPPGDGTQPGFGSVPLGGCAGLGWG